MATKNKVTMQIVKQGSTNAQRFSDVHSAKSEAGRVFFHDQTVKAVRVFTTNDGCVFNMEKDENGHCTKRQEGVNIQVLAI